MDWYWLPAIVGSLLTLAALVLSLIIIKPDSSRYRLELLNAYDGGADVKRLVADQGRVTMLAVAGSALQLVALLWQAAT